MGKFFLNIKTILLYALVICLCIGATTFGNRAVSVITEKSARLGRSTFIIDAGHGGIDGGAVSCTGVSESTINLEIALRLRDMVQFLGYRVVMLREEDTSLHDQGTTIAAQKVSDLKNRVKFVNETQGLALISIHQNTFTDPQYSGAQVFYAKTDGSKRLAEILQHNLIAIANIHSNRKSKAAKGIYLMERIQCDGVLIECGFLTNPQEEAKLRDAVYQKELCGTIGATLSQWA